MGKLTPARRYLYSPSPLDTWDRERAYDPTHSPSSVARYPLSPGETYRNTWGNSAYRILRSASNPWSILRLRLHILHISSLARQHHSYQWDHRTRRTATGCDRATTAIGATANPATPVDGGPPSMIRSKFQIRPPNAQIRPDHSPSSVLGTHSARRNGNRFPYSSMKLTPSSLGDCASAPLTT